jgi:hypothetical protein
LSAASATAPGVVVERVKVGSDVGCIVIDQSRGVQVGNNNRQLNKFKYRVEQPRVSVDDLLRGNPGRLRAFEKFVENPYSAAANRAFRRRMSAEARPAGRVRCISTSAPGTTRVSSRSDEGGGIVVSGSRGVQMGSRVTQRNKFSYRVVRPELSVGPALRQDPRLAQAFALAARQPGNPATQRLLTSHLRRAYSGTARSFSAPAARFGQATGLEARGDAVQAGSRNIRKDSLEVNFDRVVMINWPPTETRRSTAERPPGAQNGPSWPLFDRRSDNGRMEPGAPASRSGRSRRTAGRPVQDDDKGRLGPQHRPGRLEGGGGRPTGGFGRV